MWYEELLRNTVIVSVAVSVSVSVFDFNVAFRHVRDLAAAISNCYL